MTVAQLEAAVREGTLDFSQGLKPYRVICHPDRFPDPMDRLKAIGVFHEVEKLYEASRAPKATIVSPKRSYTLGRLLATGDVADVYESGDYVVKVSRVAGGNHLLEREDKTLRGIIKGLSGDPEHYLAYLPTPCESFPVRDKLQKRVNVFLKQDGFYTLEQVHARHPSLDGRHLAWIFKRILTILGITHRMGHVHGAILPCHVRVHAANHGAQAIGWGQSVEVGGVIQHGCSRYMDWYPPEVRRKEQAYSVTDIYMAARLIDWLGAPTGPIGRFVKGCLIESSRSRPDDAFGLLDELNEILERIYGKPQYAELRMEPA